MESIQGWRVKVTSLGLVNSNSMVSKLSRVIKKIRDMQTIIIQISQATIRCSQKATSLMTNDFKIKQKQHQLIRLSRHQLS